MDACRPSALGRALLPCPPLRGCAALVPWRPRRDVSLRRPSHREGRLALVLPRSRTRHLASWCRMRAGLWGSGGLDVDAVRSAPFGWRRQAPPFRKCGAADSSAFLLDLPPPELPVNRPARALAGWLLLWIAGAVPVHAPAHVARVLRAPCARACAAAVSFCPPGAPPCVWSSCGLPPWPPVAHALFAAALPGTSLGRGAGVLWRSGQSAMFCSYASLLG